MSKDLFTILGERVRYFETIRCEDGKPLHVEYHKRRMIRTVGSDFDLFEAIHVPLQNLLRS